MTIVYIILALAAGAAIGWLAQKGKTDTALANLAALQTQKEQAEQSLRAQMQQNEQSLRAQMEQNEQNMHAQMEQAERLNQAAVQAMQSRFDATIANMTAQLRETTAQMLAQRQKEFGDAAGTQLGQILEPLRQNLTDMRREVTQNTERHTELGGRMEANIRTLLSQSELARQSADRLANALRSGGRIQGDWGETILTELLQSQGLTEGVHFDTQAVIRSADGTVSRGVDDRTMRPDVILHLDRQRDVVIDSKVSLSAYLDYASATDPQLAEQALRAHIRSMRKHVDELSRKDYSTYVSQDHTPMGFVIMFVPCTAAVHAACASDTTLWRDAMAKNVYIADEQTLYAALRIIDMTWTHIQREDNHRRVYELAEQMLNRVGMFMEKYTAIGAKLADAQHAYDDGLKKLQDSGQSIPQTCQQLIKLGARSTRASKAAPTLLGHTE